MNIAGVEIGPDQPCRTVAELGNAANGSLDNMLRLIDECAAAGVDLIKTQAYTADELVALRGDGPAPEPWGSAGWSMRALYEKAATPHEWFPKIKARCRKVGVPWFSSVFGVGSLEMLLALDCRAFKVAAIDVAQDEFTTMLRDVCGPTRPGGDSLPIIASSRGERIPWADLTLYCPPGYPQDVSNFGPDQYRAAFAKCDGLSYHGTDWDIAAWSAHYGAQLLEFHVQLDDVPSKLEANVSLTISQVRDVVRGVRKASEVRAC